MKHLDAPATAVVVGAVLSETQSEALARDLARVARQLGRATEQLRLARLRVVSLDKLVKEHRRMLRLLASGRQQP